MMNVSSEPGPQAGDVIIHRTTASPPRYLINTFLSAPQLVQKTYEQALASVTGFATAQRVDVWYTDDRRSFRRVLSYRTSVSP